MIIQIAIVGCASNATNGAETTPAREWEMEAWVSLEPLSIDLLQHKSVNSITV